MRGRPAVLIILVVLNCVVLLGQLWPEGAPPFARVVNILFLLLSLFYFVAATGAAFRSSGGRDEPT
jgi:hypothetical protein